MPKKPKRKFRRIVTRYVRTRVDDEQYCQAYDQANERFTEADFLCSGLREARLISRERVNASYYPGMKMKTEE